MKLSVAGAALAGVITLSTAVVARTSAQTTPPAANVPPPAANKSTPPVWTSDPSLASNLGQEIKVLAYAVRVPTRYIEVAPAVDIQELRKNGVDSHQYRRERLPDGTAPSLGVTIATIPEKYVGKVAVVDALAHMTAQKKEAWRDFSESKPEIGTIGGISFLRTYFKGIIAAPKGKVEVLGIAYAAVDGKYIIGMEVEDVAAHYDDDRPTAEAAIMTFHRP